MSPDIVHGLAAPMMTAEYALYAIAAAALLNVIHVLVAAVRYKLIMKVMGEKISFFMSFKLMCLTLFSSLTMPVKGGSLFVKPLFLKSFTGISIKKGTASSLIELALESAWELALLLMIMLLLGGAMDTGGMMLAAFMLAVVTSLMLLSLLKGRFLMRLLFRFKKLLPSRLKNRLKRAGLSEKDAGSILDMTLGYLSNPRMIALFAVPTVAIILVSPFVLHFVSQATLSNLGYAESFVTYWVSQIIGKFSGIPSGFGAADFSMAGMLSIFGVDIAGIINIIALYRIVVILFPAISIGGPVFFMSGGRAVMRRVRNRGKKRMGDRSLSKVV